MYDQHNMLVKWFAKLQNVCTVRLLCQLKSLQDWSHNTFSSWALTLFMSPLTLHILPLMLARIAMGDISHFCKYMGLTLQVGDICICCIKVHLLLLACRGNHVWCTCSKSLEKDWCMFDQLNWLEGKRLPGERGLMTHHLQDKVIWSWLTT